MALSIVNLKGLEHADPNTLSGGQKQGLQLLLILVMEPEVILMDEPTSMLDLKGRNEIYNVIKINKDGKTIIIASHQPSDLEEVNRIIALDKGEIIFDGLKDEFYSKI